MTRATSFDLMLLFFTGRSRKPDSGPESLCRNPGGRTLIAFRPIPLITRASGYFITVAGMGPISDFTVPL